ncbi:hypothetical protein [Spirosoma luteum]|uniref:hypothetical protein n=1 Tax=Spirosoma luteum TaxID=431553 RepID=UPI00037089E9|nr:hypothetical protein [Spirosoma luteum]
MKLLLLVLLLSPLAVLGQVTIDTLHWSATRRLQLSDFHSPTQPGLGGSEFYYQIGYEVHPTSLFGQPAIESFCLMFRNMSWVSKTAQNERTLVYNQVLFDLVEVHTRQMKAKLIALGFDRRFKQRARQIEYLTNSELGDEVNRFRSETGGGDDVLALERWEKQIVQRLHDVPDLVSTYHSSKIGFGMFVGGGGILATGPLAQTFSPAGGIAFGIDIALRQTILMVHPTLYTGTLRAGFSHQNQTWDKDLPVRPRLLEVGLGQVVLDVPRIRLMPYVGYLLLDLAARDRSDERYRGLSLVSHMPTAGIVFDFKLGDNTRKPDHSDDSFLFIRTKVSYSPILNAKPFSGGLLNLQVGFGGFGRTRKVNYLPHHTTVALPAKSGKII